MDTNIFIVYLIGQYDPSMIASCRRTAAYGIEDYNYIHTITSYSKKLIVTPHILTEISNLTFDKLFYGTGLERYLIRVFQILQNAEESYLHKDELLKIPRILAKIGFSDVTILETARILGCAVLTDDGQLTGFLYNAGCLSLNMTAVRSAAWLSQ